MSDSINRRGDAAKPRKATTMPNLPTIEQPDPYCMHCGWLVPADGVRLSADIDSPRDSARAHRCEDTACVSLDVVDGFGCVRNEEEEQGS